jgi:hypothetical protein
MGRHYEACRPFTFYQKTFGGLIIITIFVGNIKNSLILHYEKRSNQYYHNRE